MSGKAFITNLTAFLPGPPVSNDDMESVLGMVGGKPSRARRTVLRSNGILSRHYAIDPATGEPTHTNASLAAEAVRRLKSNGFSPEMMDCLVCGTSIPDQLLPNHATMVHGELGGPPCEVIATAGVCLAGVTALKYAVMGVKSGEFRRAVAAASERVSAAIRARNFGPDFESQAGELDHRPEIAFDQDFLRWMLSDGAGAMLIEPAPAPVGLSLRIDWIFERSYAGEMDTCMYAGAEKLEDGSLKSWLDYTPQEIQDRALFTIKQDVRQLNAHIIQYMVKALDAVRAAKCIKPGEVDWYVPHYSSAYFRDKVYNALKGAGFEIPYDKWFTNLASKGNTGSAAIYIMLDELVRSGKLRVGERVLCYVPESSRFASAFMHLTVCDSASG